MREAAASRTASVVAVAIVLALCHVTLALASSAGVEHPLRRARFTVAWTDQDVARPSGGTVTQTDDQNRPIEPIRWPAPVLRLTLSWNGTAWRITSQRRVPSMTLPAPAVLPQGDKSRGFWVEVLDRQGRVRHREVLADPLTGMEQFDTGGQVRRLMHPAHDVQIEVLVPDLPELAELHLVSNPLARPGGHDTASGPERTRLSLGERPPGKDDDDPAPQGNPDHDHNHPRGKR